MYVPWIEFLATAAISMAVVAIHTVVDIAANTLVPSVGVRFRVAVGALKDGVVARIGMAGSTHAIRSTMIGRKPRVIKRGIQPTGGRVTSSAGRRKSR